MSDTTMDQTDIDLDYVRTARKQIIETLTKDKLTGAFKLPEDTKELAIVAGMLGDIDRVAISKKRIKVDKEINGTAATAVELIAKLFTEGNVKHIVRGGDRIGTPELPTNLEMPEILPGELDLVPVNEDYDSFMTKVQKEPT